MKKVLMVCYNNLGHIGGIQNVIHCIEKELNEHCIFDNIVFEKLENEDISIAREEKDGKEFLIPIKMHDSSLRGKLDFYIRPLYMYKKIINIIAKNGPYDIIHCHNYFEAAIFLKAAYKSNIPIRIVHSHNSFPQNNWKPIRKIYMKIYRNMINRYSTKRLACSTIAGEYLFGKNVKFEVIPNAINFEKFSVSNTVIDNENISPWSFINIGRWGEQKNQVFLIDVFAKIQKIQNSATLTLIGYGEKEDRDRIQNRIVYYNLENNVYFYPPDSDIPFFLAKNNVFLFPSNFEGLGIVLVEAQAMGLKCFASDVVPPEANLGLVDFIPLSAGPDIWANTIVQYILNNGVVKRPTYSSKYDKSYISNLYAKTYQI